MKKTAVSMLSLLISVSAGAAMGTADLTGTAPNSPIHGTVHLEDTASGLSVKAQLIGLPAGSHGFHIHEFGSCENAGTAAGAHYNPLGQNHGNVLKAGVHHAHAGDTGNIVAKADGSATLTATIPGVSLSSGPYNVAGRAFVVHEKADDLVSQPSGNAGERIACGPILLAGNGMK
jgi:Cu-Zn family superoxide dismutase